VSVVPLIAVGIDKTGQSGLPNRIAQFFLFLEGTFCSCLIHVQTHFGDSARESTTSHMSSMKRGNFSTNGSDLDQNNIHKPTFDTLMAQGCKAFEAYYANLEELFVSCCEVKWHGAVLKDTTPIVFHKLEVIPEVWPDTSSSHNDINL
jgi:hypothetical protein